MDVCIELLKYRDSSLEPKKCANYNTNCLFLQLDHIMEHVFSNGNLSLSCASIELVTRAFKILQLNLFLKSVLILFKAEKPLSQSAVDMGNTKAIVQSLPKLGNMSNS